MKLEQNQLLGKDVVLSVPSREISKAVGQSRRNVERLLRETDTRIKKIVGDDQSVGVEARLADNSEQHGRRKERCI